MRSLFFICTVLFQFQIRAQDEQFFRDLILGNALLSNDELLLKSRGSGNGQKAPTINEQSYLSPKYPLDLMSLGLLFKIQFIKSEGVDWLNLSYKEGLPFFSYRFDQFAPASYLYRITKHRLNPETLLFILYYNEGRLKYLEDTHSIRPYFLTVEHGDYAVLKKKSEKELVDWIQKRIFVFKAPAVYEEFKTYKGKMTNREYQVLVNLEQLQEVIIKDAKTTRVYQYHGLGNWKSP